MFSALQKFSEWSLNADAILCHHFMHVISVSGLENLNGALLKKKKKNPDKITVSSQS